MKRSSLIHIGIVHCHMNNICYKHRVRTKWHFLSDTALDIYRTIFNDRSINFLCFPFNQASLFKLVHIPSGTDTTEIGCFCNLSRFMQRFIRMSLRTNRNVEHGRIGTYRSCPGHCYNIIISLFISHRYHNRRKRV